MRLNSYPSGIVKVCGANTTVSVPFVFKGTQETANATNKQKLVFVDMNRTLVARGERYSIL